MSPSDASPVKSSSSRANTAQAAVLNWGVFVTAGVCDQALARMCSYEEKKITAPSGSIEA
jgi:hypothetical protein